MGKIFLLSVFLIFANIGCSNGAHSIANIHNNLHKTNTNKKEATYMGTIKPNRVKHTYFQTILAKPGKVFPLLCPEEEKLWAPGWKTQYIISESGKAELGCIFKTNHNDLDSIWIVTVYEPESYYLEMLKITPRQTVCKLCIKLIESKKGNTQATISYEYTSISESGNEFLESFTKEHYEKFMKHWENAMNHYIRTGEMIQN